MRKLIIILLLCLSTNSYAIDRIKPVTKFQLPAWAQVGLKGYWVFNNSSMSYNGTWGEVADLSGNGNVGKEVFGANCGGSGVINNCLDTNGSTQQVIITTATVGGSLEITTGSFGFWWSPQMLGTYAGFVMCMPNDSQPKWDAPYVAYGFNYDSTAAGDNCLVFIAYGGGYHNWGFRYVMTDNNWYFIIVSWNGDVMKTYINGTLQYASSSTGGGNILYQAGATPGGAPLLGFGGRGSAFSVENSKGKIDNGAVWSVVLSSVQVRQIYEWGMGE